MYEEDDYLHGGPVGMGGPDGDDDQENEEIPNEIWQEACWIVISAYFEEKGQQRTSPPYTATLPKWRNGSICSNV